MNSKFTEVYVTSDYDQFKYLKGNRSINPLNINKLKQSIGVRQLATPIIVNENMQIIDGQHRFNVCKSEKLPVYFIKLNGYGREECELLNTTGQNWTLNDYLSGFVSMGYENYIIFQNFINQHNFSIETGIAFFYFYKSGSHNLAFKLGNLTPKDLEKTYLFSEQYYDFEEVEPFKKVLFITALLRMFQHPKYNHEQMVQKLKYQGYKIQTRSYVIEYLDMLTDVYNYKTRGKRVVFN